MPAGGALFGSAATGPGSTGGNKHLVEVRAGKMTLKGRMVYPDKRKGLLYVYQSDDSLMHFCWQDRTSGVVEDDLIIFPDDCEYIKVPQCTTGRVYLLKFKSSSRKFFFWLQEPRTDKDDDNCKRINELLNNPSSAVQSSQSPDQDLQSLFNNMSQSQLMQLFGGGQMGGLSSLLGTIRGPNSGSARTSTTPAITHRTTVPSTPTTNTSTTAVSQSPATPQTTTTPTAAPGAPRVSRSSDSSCQHRIQLSDLQNFLQGISPVQGSSSQQSESGQLGPVVSQLAVNPEAVAAASQGNMQDFMKALEKNEGSSKDDDKEKKDEKKDDKDDDHMQTD